MAHGWKERSRPLEQLYDLIFDPNEASNMANDLSVATVLEEMRTRLHDWMYSTNDPLLHGPVRAPLGAELNDPAQMPPSYPTRLVYAGRCLTDRRKEPTFTRDHTHRFSPTVRHCLLR